MCEGIEEVKGEVIGIEPIGSGEPLLFARGLVRLLWEESPVLATQAGSMKAKGRPQENLCIPEELFFFLSMLGHWTSKNAIPEIHPTASQDLLKHLLPHVLTTSVCSCFPPGLPISTRCCGCSLGTASLPHPPPCAPLLPTQHLSGFQVKLMHLAYPC